MTVRATAFFVSLLFAVPPVTPAQSLESAALRPAPAFNLQDFQLPPELGSITARFQASGASPAIVLIQDAHAVPQAQKKIRDIILKLAEHGFRDIAVEGASGPLDAVFLRAFPDKKKLDAWLDALRNRGALSGVNDALIRSPLPLDARGMEDWPLYLEGIALYQAVMQKEARLLERIEKDWSREEAIKQKELSPAFYQWQKDYAAFQRGELPLVSFLQKCFEVLPPAPQSYPGLAAVYHLRRHAPFPLPPEVAEQLKQLSQGTKGEDGREINEWMQAYQTSRIDAVTFLTKFKTQRPDFYGELKLPEDLRSVVEAASFLESPPHRFYEELQRYSRDTEESWLTRQPDPENAGEIYERSRRLLLLEKLIRRGVDRAQWREISGLPEMSEYPEAAAFYENALRREASMKTALAKRLKRGKPVIAVTGGFHTEAIASWLKENRISFLVLTPSVSELPDRDFYHLNMSGEVPWARYLKGEEAERTVQKAFYRYVWDDLSKHAGAGTIRKWRENMTREYALQGKVLAVKKYRHFFSNPADPAARRSGLEAFLSGLKTAKAEKGWSFQAALRLLQAWTTPDVYTAAILAEESFWKAGAFAPPRSELRAADIPAEINLEPLSGPVSEGLKRARLSYPDIDENDYEILEEIAAKENRRAIEEGKLKVEDIFRAYMEGPAGAIHMLQERMEDGIKSWSEILFILEMYPHLFDRVYVDLDETLFAPEGYVGSESWVREQMNTYGKNIQTVRPEKYAAEERLNRQGMMRVTEPELDRRLMRLKERGVEIYGLTARAPETREVTEAILKRIGMDIPVLYAGVAYGKRSYLNRAVDEKARALQEQVEVMEKEEDRGGEADGTSAGSQMKFSLFVDDLMDRVLRSNARKAFAKKGLIALPYKPNRSFHAEKAVEHFQTSFEDGQTDRALAYAMDALSLWRLSDDRRKRLGFYYDIAEMVLEQKDEALTMAYLESIGDFLAGENKKDAPELELLLEIYFGLVTPQAKEAFAKAYQEGRLRIEAVEGTRSKRHAQMNYKIPLETENIYMFLEPLLAYIRAHQPEVLVLPDTGARPFYGLLQKFLEEEGLADKISIVLFPVSRNTAGDTPYEIRRWLRLMKGGIQPEEEEKELVRSLSDLGFGKLIEAKTVAVLDDNITTGETIAMLQNVLTVEGAIESFVALTPFAYRSPENYSFPVVSTFRVYGNYAWKARGHNKAPPLAVMTEWEYDNAKRGVKSRERFQPPPAKAFREEAAGTYQRRLLENFTADYRKGRDAFLSRAPPVPAEPAVAPETLSLPLRLKVWPGTGVLPETIEAGAGLKLVRRKGELPDAGWVFRQSILDAEKAAFLQEENVFYYEITDADGGVLGFAVLVIAEDETGKRGLVIRKLQPKMETERKFSPVDLVSGVKRFLEENETYGLAFLSLDADIVTMIEISESHWVRAALYQAYGYLPRVSGDLTLNGKASAWLNGSNRIWNRTTPEEREKIREAREYLNIIMTPKHRKLYRKLTVRSPQTHAFLKSRFEQKIRSILDAGIPVETSEFYLLKVFADFLEQNGSLALEAIDEKEAEKIRTRILFEALVHEGANTEEDLAFPEGYFSEGAKNAGLRVEAALDYFFKNIWTGGADLGKVSREELTRWGLLPVFRRFDYQKGKLLEYLAPGGYRFRGGVGYLPREGEAVSRESFEAYLRGKWYAAAPGMVYEITGEERAGPHQSFVTARLNKEKGSRVHFNDDPNHGLVAVIHRGDAVVDYLYQENGGAKNVRLAEGLEGRGPGWLDVKRWVEGAEIVPRPAEKSWIATKAHARGYVEVESSMRLHIAQENGGKEVLGIMRQDVNHGVVLDWYENKGSREEPVKGQWLNMSYRDAAGEVQFLQSDRASDRNAVWLDIVKWHQGELIEPRPGGEGFGVFAVSSAGIVNVHNAIGARYAAGPEYAGREVIGVLREDLNYGVVLEWYLNEGTKDKPRKGAWLNAYYHKGQKIYSVNTSIKRSFTYLDFRDWAKGFPVQPRPYPLNQIVRAAYDGGRILIGQGVHFNAGAEYDGREVVLSMREDLNHGVVVEIHENKGSTEQPQKGPYITTYYIEDGEPVNINRSHAKGRKMGWLDFLRWKQGKPVMARPHERSFITGRTQGSGNFPLAQGEAFALGGAFGDREVAGFLRNDINHGVVLEWYENKGSREVPVKGAFLTGHYLEDGQIRNLNASLASGRTFGWLDVVDWSRGKEITARPNEESRMLATVNKDGSISIQHLVKSSGGQKYGGKRVIGILRNDEVYGTVLEWFLNEGTDEKPVKGEMINAVYELDGKKESLQKSSQYKRTWGWLDIALWSKGRRVQPRARDGSFFPVKTDERGMVFWVSGAYFSVGKEFSNRNVVAVLRKDGNHGTVLHWYENEGTEEAPFPGRFLNGHYFTEGKKTPVSLNIATGNERGFGWLDIVKWLLKRSVTPRPHEQSYAVGAVDDYGGVTFFNSSYFSLSGRIHVGKEYAGKEILWLLTERKGQIVLDLYENTGTREKPAKGERLFTYDQNRVKIFSKAAVEREALARAKLKKGKAGEPPPGRKSRAELDREKELKRQEQEALGRERAWRRQLYEKYPHLEKQLFRLKRYAGLVKAPEHLGRTGVPEEIARLVSLWEDPSMGHFLEDDARWIEDVYRAVWTESENRVIAVRLVKEGMPRLYAWLTERLADEGSEHDPLSAESLESGSGWIFLADLLKEDERFFYESSLEQKEADRLYAGRYSGVEDNVFPVTLHGHLYLASAYPENERMRAKLLRYREKMEDGSARWLPEELEEIHRAYLGAVERDKEWEAAQTGAKARGNSVWSLRNIVTLLKERKERELPIHGKAMADAGYAGAEGRIVELLGEPWEAAMILAGMSREEAADYKRKIRASVTQAQHLKRGNANWNEETIRQEVMRRYSRNDWLLYNRLSVAMVKAAMKIWGEPWPKAFAAIAGISVEEAEAFLEKQRKRSAGERSRQAAASRAKSEGRRVWNAETLPEFIRTRHREGEPLLVKKVGPGPASAGARLWGSWEKAVASSLEMSLEEVERLLGTQREQARKRGDAGQETEGSDEITGDPETPQGRPELRAAQPQSLSLERKTRLGRRIFQSLRHPSGVLEESVLRDAADWMHQQPDEFEALLRSLSADEGKADGDFSEERLLWKQEAILARQEILDRWLQTKRKRGELFFALDARMQGNPFFDRLASLLSRADWDRVRLAGEKGMIKYLSRKIRHLTVVPHLMENKDWLKDKVPVDFEQRALLTDRIGIPGRPIFPLLIPFHLLEEAEEDDEMQSLLDTVQGIAFLELADLLSGHRGGDLEPVSAEKISEELARRLQALGLPDHLVRWNIPAGGFKLTSELLERWVENRLIATFA